MAEKTDLSVASGGSTPKKRVRFKEDDAVLEFKRHEDKRPKGMDPMEALEGVHPTAADGRLTLLDSHLLVVLCTC